jgi:3-hydroxyisobutyrate dehydrogenase
MAKDNIVAGFIGLGTMGGRMAANLQKAGYSLVVHDLHRQTASHHLAAGRRFTFDSLVDQFLPGTYDPPAFSLKLAHKDVGLANALGRELGLPMRLCNLTLAEMTEAMARGWGGSDSRIVMRLAQERAGIDIAVDPARLRDALVEGTKPA